MGCIGHQCLCLCLPRRAFEVIPEKVLQTQLAATWLQRRLIIAAGASFRRSREGYSLSFLGHSRGPPRWRALFAARRAGASRCPPPLQGGPRGDGVVPVESDLRHGGPRASDEESQAGCSAIALSCMFGGSRLVSPVLPSSFGGQCVGRLGASTSPMACFALPLPFDLRRSSGLPHATHQRPRRRCRATVSRGVATKRTGVRQAVCSSSWPWVPTPPLALTFLLCAARGTRNPTATQHQRRR